MLLMDQDPVAQTKAKEAFFQEQLALFLQPFIQGFLTTLQPCCFVSCFQECRTFSKAMSKEGLLQLVEMKTNNMKMCNDIRYVSNSCTTSLYIILICTKLFQSHVFFSRSLERIVHLVDLQDGPYFLGKEISMVDIALFPFWQRFLWVGSYYRGWLTRT